MWLNKIKILKNNNKEDEVFGTILLKMKHVVEETL